MDDHEEELKPSYKENKKKMEQTIYQSLVKYGENDKMLRIR